MIFPKVTNGFRAEWGAKVYAAAVSVIATGRLYGRSALNALRAALTGGPLCNRADNAGGGEQLRKRSKKTSSASGRYSATGTDLNE